MVTGFTATSVLARTVTIWIRNLIPFTVLALIVFAPLAGYVAIALGGDAWHSAHTIDRVEWVSFIGGSVLGLLLTATFVYGVFQQLRDRRPSIAKCVTIGLARLLPAIGVSLMVSLAVLAGTLALVVPGIIIACMLWVAVPVTVVERPNIMEALQRSRDLTEGRRLQVFFVLLVLQGLHFAILYLLEGRLISGDAISAGGVRSYFVATVLLQGLFATLEAVAATIAYHDLRAEKEGVGVDELIEIFK